MAEHDDRVEPGDRVGIGQRCADGRDRVLDDEMPLLLGRILVEVQVHSGQQRGAGEVEVPAGRLLPARCGPAGVRSRGRRRLERPVQRLQW
jgi:hypothetical protein